MTFAWLMGHETGWKPIAATEAAAHALCQRVGLDTRLAELGPPFIASALAVRASVGSASLGYIGLISLAGFALPIFTPLSQVGIGPLIDYLIERTVVVSAADARTLRARVEALHAPGLSVSGSVMVDEALCRKVTKVVWVAATSLREADGDADHISRADLDRVRQTDLELLGGVAGISADRVVDAALGIFDLYDGDGDGQLSFVELSVGLLTLASLVTLGSAHADLDEEARLRATFAVLDVDGSGRLEERELVAWVRALAKLGGVLGAQTETAAPARPGAAARFMSHPAESSAAAETIVAGWLRELDTDGDGTLSREEFARLAPRLRLGRAVAHLTGAAEAPKHKT